MQLSPAAMSARSLPFRNFGLLLLALALVVRALLPQGFMPVASAEGLRMEMCGGAGPVTIVLDRDAQPQNGQKPAPCPYALAGAGIDLPPELVLPAPLAHIAPPPAPQPVAARLAAQRALRPPARGPPTLA